MSDANVVRIQRPNLVVAELDRALAFYVAVLGFDVAFIKDHNPDSYSIEVFEMPEGTQQRFCVLSTPAAPRCLALTEVTGATLLPVPAPRRAALVIEVSDVDQVVKGARDLGLTVFREETLHTHDGRTGREVGILDPDDHLIVIYRIA